MGGLRRLRRPRGERCPRPPRPAPRRARAEAGPRAPPQASPALSRSASRHVVDRAGRSRPHHDGPGDHWRARRHPAHSPAHALRSGVARSARPPLRRLRGGLAPITGRTGGAHRSRDRRGTHDRGDRARGRPRRSLAPRCRRLGPHPRFERVDRRPDRSRSAGGSRIRALAAERALDGGPAILPARGMEPARGGAHGRLQHVGGSCATRDAVDDSLRAHTLRQDRHGARRRLARRPLSLRHRGPPRGAGSGSRCAPRPVRAPGGEGRTATTARQPRVPPFSLRNVGGGVGRRRPRLHRAMPRTPPIVPWPPTGRAT